MTIIEKTDTPVAWAYGEQREHTQQLSPGAECTSVGTFIGTYIVDGTEYVAVTSKDCTIQTNAAQLGERPANFAIKTEAGLSQGLKDGSVHENTWVIPPALIAQSMIALQSKWPPQYREGVLYDNAPQGFRALAVETTTTSNAKPRLTQMLLAGWKALSRQSTEKTVTAIEHGSAKSIVVPEHKTALRPIRLIPMQAWNTGYAR
ncbi:MAG: hypothetical protein EB059_00230 [Alphaproteobacteria bacterium]|nr:hypothetical protein [Alphaproteobacteria bacterium]